MQALLSPMTGRYVTIEQVNSEQLAGRLIHIASDYLAILDQNESPVYLQLGHIVSVITNHAELILPMDAGTPELSSSFAELLRSLIGRMIRIGVGNRTTTGIINEVNNQDISLILDIKHTIYYPIQQIQRFSLVFQPDESKESNSKKESQASQESTKEQQVSEHDEPTNASNPITVTDLLENSHQDREDGSSGTSGDNLTVFQVKQVDLDEWNDSSTTQTDSKPAPKREMMLKPRSPNRTSEQAGSTKLTLFDSNSKPSARGGNAFRRKFP
jgi:hypothetical protein